jgi:hypothetical protein
MVLFFSVRPTQNPYQLIICGDNVMWRVRDRKGKFVMHDIVSNVGVLVGNNGTFCTACVFNAFADDIVLTCTKTPRQQSNLIRRVVI